MCNEHQPILYRPNRHTTYAFVLFVFSLSFFFFWYGCSCNNQFLICCRFICKPRICTLHTLQNENENTQRNTLEINEGAPWKKKIWMNWRKKKFTKIKQLKAIIVNMDLNGTRQGKKSIWYGFSVVVYFALLRMVHNIIQYKYKYEHTGKLIRREKNGKICNHHVHAAGWLAGKELCVKVIMC